MTIRHYLFKTKKHSLYQKYVAKALALSACIASIPTLSFASKANIENAANVEAWPWEQFLNALAQQLTGPLPLTLGVLGLAAAAIAMFTGNHGAGTQKFIILIFAVSICLFAPNFVEIIHNTAGGATIFGIP